MSAVAVAPLARRARTRTLSVVRLTPEEELEQLVSEQEKDDTYCVNRPGGVISFDGPAPGMEGVVSDFIGVDENGETISFLPRSDESLFSTSLPHATFDAYTNHKCRCVRCKGFMAEYMRAYRRLRRAK